MALTFKKVPEQTFFIGPSAGWRVYQATPAASDYATGGYLITPAQVDMANIIGATILGTKYQAGGTIIWQINQPATSYGTNPVESSTGVYLTAWQAAGVTATGTVSAPTITTLTNAGTTAPIYTNGGALTQTTGATGITGVQAPTFTGTATTAADFAEVGAGTDLSGFPLWILFIGY